MSAPFQLRPHKAVDRHIFLEAVDQLRPTFPLKDITYYGLGGPFLDDIRLFSSRFPDLRYVSIERERKVHLRQDFHKNSRRLKLKHMSVRDYLDNEFPDGDRCIFWLDYYGFELDRVYELQNLIAQTGNNSIVKFTANVSATWNDVDAAIRLTDDLDEKQRIKTAYAEEYFRTFEVFLDDVPGYEEIDWVNCPVTAMSILQTACTSAIPEGDDREFQIIHSCSYADGPHKMLSILGVVTEEADTVVSCLNDWRHANFSWDSPFDINLPELSAKERLKLERLLPTASGISQLRRSLGYSPGGQLEQYREFNYLLPVFAKIGW